MIRRLAPVLVGLALLVPAPGYAGTAEVEIGDHFFAPDAVRGSVGGSVRWVRAPASNGVHNVREDGRLFRSGPPTSGPIDYTAVFSSGTFHFFCETHGGPLGSGYTGMDGFVRVPVSISRRPAGLPFTVRWASGASETGNAYDVQFRIGSGDWRTWKKDTTNNKGVFGKDARPVRVRAGTRYSFRARSQDGPNASGWSPPASLRP